MPHHGEGPHLDDHDHDHDTEDRAGGWAGVPEALGMPDTLDTDTDAANRPAGVDYGADDRPPRDTPAAEPR
jgi:hypothetical protein